MILSPCSPRDSQESYPKLQFKSINSLALRFQQWPQDWRRSVFIPIPKKDNAKECSNYCTIALISHASKVMLKILQARLQQYVNHELPVVQAGFRKGRGNRDQIANICWIIEKTTRKKCLSVQVLQPNSFLLMKKWNSLP